MKVTINEQILLLAIWRLDQEAYGVNIRQLYNDYTGKDTGYGAIYNNLDQLIKKGYTTSFKGEATAIRGGKRKVYYQITPLGLKALQNARDLQNKLWADIPESAFRQEG